MFARQWFPNGSQYGLTNSASQYRQLFESRSFTDCTAYIADHLDSYPDYWNRQLLRLKSILKLLVSKQDVVYIFWDCFWPDFDIYNNQILDYFRAAVDFNINSTTSPSEAQISIYSCYGNYNSFAQTRHTTRILFLGENVRPAYGEFDYSLSSDVFTYSGLNCYMPLWLFEIDIFSRNYPDRNPYAVDLFTTQSSVNLSDRSKAAVFVGNNNEPFRCTLLNLLSANGLTVDYFGSHSKPVVNKIDLYKNYKYVIAPENSYSHGYVTEKLMHAYLSDSYFLYWGGIADLPLTPPPSMIYVSPSTCPDSMISKVINDDYPDSYIKPPLIDNSSLNVSMDSISSFISKILTPYSRSYS